MKVVIIGGVAGGATTATRLRRLDERAEIIVFERGNHISFANCGLPYYIGDVIQKKQELLLQTPKSFRERFNIDVRVKTEVIKINKEDKQVIVKDYLKNVEYSENYDKLVIATGAEPINPFRGINADKIFTLRNVEDSVRIKDYIGREKPNNICVIGGGYIGVEISENIRQYGRKNNYNPVITIIDRNSHLIPTLDKDMAEFVHRTLRKNNINVLLQRNVDKIEENCDIKVSDQNEEAIIKSDLIIVSMGVKPESKLAIEAKLETTERNNIVVDEHMLTSDNNIYALGDAVQVINSVTQMPSYIPLAGPANRQARIVANNICGIDTKYEGAIGSSILKIFNNNLAMTGISEDICKAKNISYKKMIITPYSHATYYPGASHLTIKALYTPESGRILGATVWGKENVDKIADILATAIRMKMTAQNLSELELCYAPPFSAAKSPVNILGNAIENEIDGLVSNAYVEDIKDKLNSEEKPYILDVRTDEEYERGHIKNVVHISLDSLRENLEKIDKSKEIYVHCFTGLRSYIACMILKQNGYNVKNIIGGQYFMEVNGINFEKDI